MIHLANEGVLLLSCPISSFITCYFIRRQNIPLPCTALNFTALPCTALHFNAPDFKIITTLDCTLLYWTARSREDSAKQIAALFDYQFLEASFPQKELSQQRKLAFRKNVIFLQWSNWALEVNITKDMLNQCFCRQVSKLEN